MPDELAHLRLIRALGGNEGTGMCPCPAHDDAAPSLHVGVGDKVSVLLYCYAGCTFEQITSALARMNWWPVPGSDGTPHVVPQRSAEERRHYAVRILADTRRNRGRELAHLLADYFARRGLNTVPATALLGLPWCYMEEGRLLVPRQPAMIFRVADGRLTLGIHVTWLNPDLTDKREEEPQRQFFGPIKGGFVKLFRGRHDPALRLVIAEGVETACAAGQLTGLPAISALSAENLPLITPPPASEYIIAADNDANGVGQAAARALARKLAAAGGVVRIAVPKRPDTDWNDEVMS
jgi:putative DNA primase/helicase